MLKLFQKKNLWAEARNAILIFLALAVIMVSSAVIELRQSKKELLQLMATQSHSLLESLLISSQNILRNNQLLARSYRERMVNTADLIKILYERHRATPQVLREMARENTIRAIQIIHPSGEPVVQISANGEKPLPMKSVKQLLLPIFNGETDTLIFVLRNRKQQNIPLYIIALASKDHSAIVLTVDAREMVASNSRAGFGPLLRSVVIRNPFIIYAALQDTSMLLAASGNVRELEALNDSPFLRHAFYDSLYLTRITDFDSVHVFEAVHPFSFNGRKLGLFRLGLSMKPVNDINARIYRRLIFITILLIVLGGFMLTYLFTKQRFYSLKKDYAVVETYSTNIIQNVSDAIIVCDENEGIRIFNRAAEKLFAKKESEVLGRPLNHALGKAPCAPLLEESFSLRQIECKFKNQVKILLVSKTKFTIHETATNTIFVIRDLTEQKAMEEQLNRKKRLTAMGELAAGVAHEIRNPLNAIATIVQQLDKDFEPPQHKEEYHSLARLVYNEVKRINRTIQDFLQFSRPEPLRPKNFEIKSLIDQIVMQYQNEAQRKNIALQAALQWNGTVFADPDKLAQVLSNLVRNALEAMNDGGRIHINVKKLKNDRLQITVADTGPGIPKEMQAKIFNLYFTTKASGTGIGLSIVQRIVDQHNGLIRVNSVPGEGTEFIIQIPRNCC